MNPKFKFTAKKKNSDGEIYLYGDIGATWDGSGITAKAFVASLQDLKKQGAKDLSIFINSGGGSVFEGMAIYNAFKRWDGKKTIRVDGWAASAASLICMAADSIFMSDAGIMMIHEPSGVAIGTMKEMDEVKSRLEKIRDSMVTVYANRTGKTEPAIKELMAAETWMTSAEAIDQGFADGDYKGSDDIEMKFVASSQFLQHYHNVPESIRAAAREPLLEERTKMDFTLLLRALGLAADSSEAQAIKAVDDLRAESKTADGRHKSILAELEELTKLSGKPSTAEAKGIFLAWKSSQDQVAKLMEEKRIADETARAAEIKVTVDNGVRDGKIPPSMKEFWSSQSLETVKAYVEKAPKIVGEKAPIAEPAPASGAVGSVELTPAQIDDMCKRAGITDPKMKDALIARVKDQNATLAQQGIRISNTALPA